MKIQKILSAMFAILILTLFSGCTKEVIVEVPKPYAVPVPCKVPDVHCEAKGEDNEVIVGLLQCIIDLKRAAEVCK